MHTEITDVNETEDCTSQKQILAYHPEDVNGDADRG